MEPGEASPVSTSSKMGGSIPIPIPGNPRFLGNFFLGELFLGGNFNPLLLLPSFSSLLGPKDPDFTPRSFGSVGAAAAGTPFWGIFLKKKKSGWICLGWGRFSIREFREIKKNPNFWFRFWAWVWILFSRRAETFVHACRKL